MTKHFKATLSLTLVCGFLLGIHEGRLTLWRDGEDHPEQIYDIRADSLPPADRLQLSRGIRAQSREEVWQLLENYLD